MSARSPIEDILPLTPLQEGLLFHSVYDETGVDVYVAQLLVDLTGPLDAGRLRRAAEALVRRHPTLRAGFVRDAGSPVQVVLREVAVPWTHTDLGRLGEAARTAELTRLVESDRLRRFDLEQPPLIRFQVITTGPGRHRLVMTNHHIALDGWSTPLLMRDLFALYAADGDPAGLPAARPHRDFLAWLAQQDRDAARTAWRTALDGVTEPTLIAPGDRSDTPLLPEQVTTRLAPDLTDRLTALARSRGVTLNTVVQTGWAILLNRLTGRRDVLFGTTVSGRSPLLPGVGTIVGLLINTLPVRVRLDPAETVSALLTRVQAEQAALIDHQHLGLAEIQRIAGAGELFDTLTVFESFPFDADAITAAQEGAGLTAAATARPIATHYPLTLMAEPAPTGLGLTLKHRPDLYDRAGAETLLDRFRRVLKALADDPGARTARVDALSPGERRALLAPAAPAPAPPPNATLPALFEEQAARTPDRVAVVDGGRSLTYRELNTRANRLAHRLIDLGAGPEDLVALALPRSGELVVAVLAVLKTGAGYLPVDPDYPADRIRLLLTDARPAALLTVRDLPDALADALAGGAAPPTLRLDDPGVLADLDRRPGSDPADRERRAPLHPDHPAYAIYTSGSTGVPKGVLVPHRNVVQLFSATAALIEPRADDVWTLFHSYAFDFSVWELWGPLLHGGRLVIVPAETSRSPEDFLALLDEQRVTVLSQTPSAFHQLAEAVRERGAPAAALRTVVFGGEALRPPRLAGWYAAHPDGGPRLVNMYGITETTVHATHQPLHPATTSTAASPIGHPLPGLSIHLLTPELDLAPPGVIGELYVGGPQLARGYLGLPALTAARFVASPFAPGERLYRSGDLARRTADGALEFAGRADDQVKIRGFRIEPGEVEAAVAAHPAVSRCVVVARTDDTGGPRLIAYAATAGAAPPAPAELRAHTEARLPPHMVPASFTVLDALPLTPHGKVDHRALPAPDTTGAAPARPPSGPAEAALCDLFAQVLHVDRVGPDDSFFELGGDSILAIGLVSRARAAELPLTPRDVFAHRTPTALARAAGRTVTAPAAPDDGAGEIGPTPITAWLESVGGPVDGLSQSASLTVPPGTAEASLVTALQTLTDHHDALRLRADRGARPWTLAVRPPTTVAAAPRLRRVDCAGHTERQLHEEAARHAETARARLDPDTGDILRAVWLDPGPDRPGLLLLVLHHLAVDGVSWRILLPDLATALDAASRGAAPGLPAPTTSLRRWARLLGEEARHPRRTAELPLWTEILSDPGPLLKGRRPDPAHDTHGTAGRLELQLPAHHTEPLLGRVPAAFHAGVQDILLTALALALAQWPEGGRPAVIDVESHGRHEHLFPGTDLSRTVGWFTAVHPVRLTTEPLTEERLRHDTAALGRAVKDVKEQLRAIPDHGIGHGLLRRLNPDTAPALAALPAPLLGFNYLGRFAAPDSAATAGGPVGGGADPAMPLAHALEVNAATWDTPAGPRLAARWTWAPGLLAQDRVHDLATAWFTALEALAATADTPGTGGRTPSDLPLIQLTQGDIDALEAEFDDAEFDDAAFQDADTDRSPS
ncbi:amino acid adenylation domain-containing protein [Streptomyces sp. NPDC014894]|uniref:amino acid adenylation domain-containing protein n=1 Tax=Streptomyces sp. NPDC014894 TaxID=3364931 RepID=UPI0037004141